MNELVKSMSLLFEAWVCLNEANEKDPNVEQCVDLERLKEIRYEVADFLAAHYSK